MTCGWSCTTVSDSSNTRQSASAENSILSRVTSNENGPAELEVDSEEDGLNVVLYRIYLDVDPAVLCEIVRFMYTGEVHLQDFPDKTGLMMQLFLQGDYLALDHLVDKSLSWLAENVVVARKFYELLSIFARNLLVSNRNQVKLHDLLVDVFSRGWKDISNDAEFASVPYSLLLDFLRCSTEPFPMAIMYKWNTYCDKPIDEVRSIRTILKSEMCPEAGIWLIDAVSEEAVNAWQEMELCNDKQEVNCPIQGERKFFILISGLNRNLVTLQGGKFLLRQTSARGIYEVTMTGESEVRDPAGYITGSSESVQVDLTVGGSVTRVSVGDRTLLSTKECYTELKIRISSQIMGEVNTLSVY